jgi:hypothetical protein
VPYCVNTITGTVGWVSCTRFSSSRPLVCGSIRSVSKMSTAVCSKTSIASSAVATVTAFIPLCCATSAQASRILSTISRIAYGLHISVYYLSYTTFCDPVLKILARPITVPPPANYPCCCGLPNQNLPRAPFHFGTYPAPSSPHTITPKKRALRSFPRRARILTSCIVPPGNPHSELPSVRRPHASRGAAF